MNRPYDKARYKALLDGLELTEVKLSELKSGVRIDAEMYQKFYVESERLITSQDFTLLGNEAISIKKGIFDIKADSYTESGIPFVRISNLKDMVTNENDLVFISESEHLKNGETALIKDDVILSKTAYPAASIVTFEECNTSQDTIAVRLKRQSELRSQYLVAFLNTRYGLGQMKRWFTGNIQMHLNLTDCKNLPIPIFAKSLQRRAKNLFEKSILLRNQSRNLYVQAENLLLEELGLRNWHPPEDNIAVKSFEESFANTGRLDSEYYQPKYDELVSTIRRKATYCQAAGSLSIFNQRGEQPVYFEDGKLNTINSRHILEQHLDYENFEKTDIDEWQKRPDARVFENDVLIYTTGANVGRTNVYLSDEKALASNHVNILRIRHENPLYVGFVLNSLVGRMQTRRIVTGSAQAELYPDAIATFLVPFIAPEKQTQVSRALRKSYSALCGSKRILDVAKRAVEIAIEQNERAALKWIDESKV